MASNTLESSRGAREDAKAQENGKPAEVSAGAPPAGGTGLKAWLPLLVAVITMPALAYATTHFLLLPRLEHDLAKGKAGLAPEQAAEGAATEGGEGKSGSSKARVAVNLNKMLVNVAGTMGTRYLMTSVTLVGNTPDFKSKIDDNKDQLMDLATGTLSSKTISDLEKPGARNVIRAELMTVINNALGGPVVQEIYITEMAIQ